MHRYSQTAIFLHWTIAVLLAFQISLGLALEELGARAFSLFQLHKSIGISILILTLIRIAVRYYAKFPDEVDRWITRVDEEAERLEQTLERERSLLE